MAALITAGRRSALACSPASADSFHAYGIVMYVIESPMSIQASVAPWGVLKTSTSIESVESLAAVTLMRTQLAPPRAIGASTVFRRFWVTAATCIQPSVGGAE